MTLRNKLEYSTDTNRDITEKGEIEECLELALKFHWRLTYLVMIDNHVESHEVELTAVNETPGTFTLLGEFPITEFDQEKSLHFRAASGGMSFVFKSELEECTAFFTRSECQFQIPDTIRFTQLRSAIRINFTDTEEIPVSFHASAERAFSGKVVDLSETGAKIKFEGNVTEYMGHSDIVADCQLLLPTGAVVDSNVQVLGCLYDPDQDTSYVRCRFLQLHVNSELQLRALIFDALKKLGMEDAMKAG